MRSFGQLCLLAAVLGSTVLNCNPRRADRPAAEQAAAQVSRLGLLVREKDQVDLEYVAWESEATLQATLVRLRKSGGGEIQVLPGEYEIHQGFEILDSTDIQIRGAETARFVFAPGPEVFPRLTKEVLRGETTLVVDEAARFRAGWKYQVYKSDGKGDRLLEFRVTAIQGKQLTIAPKVSFMGHVKEIPADSIIIEQVTFFTLNRSERITLSGLNFDGRSRGKVHGHTTFCGVLATGDYRAGRRPVKHGLTIEHCSFRALKGRGIAAYGLGDISVRGCYFDDIDTQAVEIDHYSTGVVVGNEIHNAGAGVTLNDAFDSVVEGNMIVDCATGVALQRHFDEDWVNTGHSIRSNVFIRSKRPGSIVFSRTMTGNEIRNNRFIDVPEKYRLVRSGGNELSGNRAIE